MAIAFDVARVRRPVFFVFRLRETAGPAFLGLVTAPDHTEALAQACETWDGREEDFLSMEWWRAVPALEQEAARAT
jgi:hypothetical protein